MFWLRNKNYFSVMHSYLKAWLYALFCFAKNPANVFQNQEKNEEGEGQIYC